MPTGAQTHGHDGAVARCHGRGSKRWQNAAGISSDLEPAGSAAALHLAQLPDTPQNRCDRSRCGNDSECDSNPRLPDEDDESRGANEKHGNAVNS